MDRSSAVLLFKGEKANDSYHSLLSQNGYEPAFEPVLDFEFVNKTELVEALLGSKSTPCDAIVATSARSLEAISNILSESDVETSNAVRAIWKSRTLFVVAESTRSAMPMEFAEVHSGETDASQLCKVIAGVYPSAKPNGEPWRLLFLCSSIRRDVLPTFFGDASDHKHIQLVELKVYATKKLSITEVADDGASKWWVFFSPSGVDAVLSSLISSDSSRKSGIPHNVKVASIGKTTSEALRDAGVEVHAVASTPSADGLLECLQAHDRSSSSTPL